MRQLTHTQAAHSLQPTARQQVLLHAVVGSLVLCAVLGPTTARAGVIVVQAQHAAQPSVGGQKVHFVKLQAALGTNAARNFLRALAPAQAAASVLNNMTVSANGKRLAMQPALARERISQLLRQHLSIP